MDGISQRGRLSGNVTKGRTSDRSRRAGKRLWTQKEAPNSTNLNPREEEKVTVSFIKLQISKLIDAISRGLQSSSRRSAPSPGKITSGPITAPEKHPTLFAHLSKHQLARIFDPLVTTISILSSRKGVSRVSYETVRSMMAHRTQEMKSLGWSSFEQILKIASHARVVQVIRVGWNDKFLKLLLPLVGQQWVGSDTPKRLRDTEYFSKRGIFMGTTPYFLGRKGVALSKLAEEEYDALGGDNSASGVSYAYSNLLPTSPAPKVSQGGSVSAQLPLLPLSPRRNAEQSTSKPPREQYSEKALTSSKTRPVPSPSVLPPTQLGTPMQPAPRSTHAPFVPPTTQISSNNLKYTTLSFPLKHRAVISILIQLTDGACEEKVRVEDAIASLKMEYRGVRENFLYSLVVKGQEEGVVGRERDQDGVEWAWLRSPSRLDIIPPVFPPEPFRDEIPNPNTKEFITTTIPYGETRHGGDAARTDVKDPPSNAKPSRVEARRGALTLALKHRLISILIRLTKGFHGGKKKARVDELTRLLKQECPQAQKGFLLSIIREAEEEKLLICERDRRGVEWACLKRPDTSDTALLPVKPAKNIERNGKRLEVWNPAEPHPPIPSVRGNGNAEAGAYKVPCTLEQTPTLTKFKPLVACISRLRGNKPESKVPYHAVKRRMDGLKEELKGLGWPSIGMLMDAAYKAGVVEPIRRNSTSKLEYLRLIPQPLMPLHVEAMSEVLQQQQLTLERFPGKCRAVTSTMLRLTGDVLGAKVCIRGLSTSLAHEFPSSRGPWYQISQAEEEGILAQEKDDVGITWVCLKHSCASVVMYPPLEATALPPSAPPHAPQSGLTRLPMQMQPGHLNVPDENPSSPPDAMLTPSPHLTVSVDTSPPAPQASARTLSRITAASCPPKHRAVVATLIRLTDGTPGKKVRMDDWMSSLRGEYPGAREEYLLSLIAEAEEDGVETRGRDQDGVQWAWLNSEEVSNQVMFRLFRYISDEGAVLEGKRVQREHARLDHQNSTRAEVLNRMLWPMFLVD